MPTPARPRPSPFRYGLNSLAFPAPAALALAADSAALGYGVFLVGGLAVALMAAAMRSATRRAGASAREAYEERERADREVAERLRLERAEREARDQLHATLSGVGDGVIVTDDVGWVVSLNPVAEGLTGWSTDEAAGRPLREVFRTVDLDTKGTDEVPVARVVEGGVVGPMGNTELIAKTGACLTIEQRASPIRDGRGSVHGVVIVFRDVGERQRAEREVRESGERLRQLADSMPQIVWTAGPDGTVEYFNGRWYEYTGLGPSESLSPEGWKLVVHPDDLPALYALRNRAVGDGDVFVAEVRLRDRRGVYRWQLVRSVPVLDEGRVARRIGTATDVDDYKRAQEALRASEERLRLIMESALDYAIFTLDLDHRVATWNSGARQLFGYEASEIVGADDRTLFTPEDAERGAPEAEIRSAGEQGRAENERWHLRKDGSRFWASGLMMPLREGGRVIGYLKIMRDTTERKRTEQELELSRERLNFVVNSNEVGLWYCDLPFDKLLFNAKCKEHFGLPPGAEVTIGLFYERLHPDDRETTRQAIERSIRERNDYDIEYRTVAADGRVRWVRALGRAFYDVEGTATRFDGITVDVTRRIRQEEALRQADQRKDEFLATLAHELRNPLASIRNALFLMGRPSGAGQDNEAERAMAERQVVHLASLVDDLLDVARISRGKIELKPRVVALEAVVRHAVEAIRSALTGLGHDLTVVLPDEPVHLKADPTRLEQVFYNLLSNAAKYTEPGGWVTIEAAREGSEAVVRVRDTGIGIPADMLPRVFELFVQVDHRSDRAQGGLGIGLGLVKSLVELHGGTITAHSEGAGLGSEFVVRLPVLTEPVEARTTREAPPTPANGPPRRRILVVDDNADAANSLAKLLSRVFGQDVEVAHDGPSALEAAGRFRPEIVLLDIGMPGMDGYEVARRLRVMPGCAGTTLVALTGWGQEADRKRSREAGFDHHLVKPIDPESLPGLLSSSWSHAD